MKFVILTSDPEVTAACQGAFQQDDEVVVTSDRMGALEDCRGADMIFVDFLATLTTPHKVAGYEEFAEAKMSHPDAGPVPLVLIWPPEDYAMDFMTGFPGFVFQSMQRPVTARLLRRASTYV